MTMGKQHKKRLTAPLVRDQGSLRSASWEEALDRVALGFRRAIDQLQLIAGRQLIDEDERLISPTSASGQGVDAVVATFGADLEWGGNRGTPDGSRTLVHVGAGRYGNRAGI